jgi:hypothetical protein
MSDLVRDAVCNVAALRFGSRDKDSRVVPGTMAKGIDAPDSIQGNKEWPYLPPTAWTLNAGSSARSSCGHGLDTLGIRRVYG